MSDTSDRRGAPEQAPEVTDDAGHDAGHDADQDPDGWEPAEGVVAVADVLDLTDLDLVAEVTHPIRGRILRRLKHPRTVAELAADLDVPVTRLYHHVNRLEAAGLIRVVATRRVAAVTERRYQVVAKSFRLARPAYDELDRRELAVALGSLFDVAKVDLEHAVENGTFATAADDDDDEWVLSLGELTLSTARRLELAERVHALIEEFSSDTTPDDPDGTRVTMFVATFPTPL